MPFLEYRAEAADAGRTVRALLKGELHFSSHAISRLTRAEGTLLLNGAPVHTNAVVAAGDLLAVESGDLRPPGAAPVPGDWPLPVVYEDEHLLVVDKPAGMTAHLSNFLPETPTVAGALAYQRGGGFLFHPVNRLDKGTTGLMAVAKSGHVHNLLRKTLHTNEFHREYRAVCLGRPPLSSGVVDGPIGRDETSAVARMIRPDGLPAVTRYRVLARLPGPPEMTFLALMPETGRTHQLRVHMASLGCPLAGDWLYGTEDPDLIPRPALHAYAIHLVHPITGTALDLTAPLPADIQKLLNGGTQSC